MEYLKKAMVLLTIFFITGSCKKVAADGSTNNAPSNLMIISNVNIDGSGSVLFTATADNAISYLYDFGNGETRTIASGVINYKYVQSGTNTFTVTVTASSNTGLSIKQSIQVTVTVIASSPLIWADEFNTDGAPDPAKWGFDFGAGGWGNAELEYYTDRPENAIVQGGVLKIKAIKENYKGSAYTSARLLSKDKFVFTYGKVEVRAKIPAGVGTWPAIWMLGSNINTAGWPGCGEIDIMEHVGKNLNTIYGTLHYPGKSGGNADGNTIVISNATTEFHTYTLDWSSTSIKIYVDGQLYHTVTNSNAIPFNHDFFFILNIAMGGNFAGSVDPYFSSATMEIDYIRVYK